ncbi:MAG: GntR family transcriptional regulator [Planctomycetes bacterium]|nr:GntR family transcriptional regulator [Planctomycetota bacterium]
MTSTSPKHALVREQLRQKIVTGEFAPGTRLPPEVELFKMLMASNTTVVRALNDLVREGLIVRQRGNGTFVAERRHPPLIPGRNLRLGVLWYHPIRASMFDTFCHRMSLGALSAWGLEGVVPDLDEDRAMTFTRGVWRQPARGLTVECLGSEWNGSDRAPSLEVVRQAGYDAVLTVGIIEEWWLEALLALRIPTVLVDFPTQRFAMQADAVYADPQSAYRSAVDHFIVRGLKRIHFVGANVWDPTTKITDASRPAGFRFGKRIDPDSFLRLSAYRQAMDAHGLPVTDASIHFQGDEYKETAAKLAALPEDKRPEALVCHSAEQAEHLIGACADRGLSLEAAGAHDRPRAGRALNIRLDTRVMGAVAAEILLSRLKQPERPYLNVGVRMVFDGPLGQDLPVHSANETRHGKR